VLDPESSFKDLGSLVGTLLRKKRPERAALKAMEKVLSEIWAERAVRLAQGEDVPDDNLTSMFGLYKDKPFAHCAELVARDVFHFHLASLANMYAALSWTLVRLLTTPCLAEVCVEMELARSNLGDQFYLDTDVLESGLQKLESVFQESLRIAQQSITLRKVMKPCVLETEACTFTVPAGYYLTTLLSVTNTCPKHVPVGAFQPTEFAPERYAGSKLLGPTEAFGVSTFGHGSHTCPGQKFALYATKVIISLYLQKLNLVPCFASAAPPATSVGAIGRAEFPCVTKFTKIN